MIKNSFKLQCVRKVTVRLKKCWKWSPRASIQAWARLILFANASCRCAFEMFLMNAVIASNTEPVSRDVSISLRNALRWGSLQGFLRIFQQIAPVYLFSSRNTYSRRKTLSSTERNILSTNWGKQLRTLPVMHFNRCLTTEYSETTAHFNGNFDTYNQIYVP
jgi:hypothetical protein